MSMTIAEQLFMAELKAKILEIANDLDLDERYSKQDAVQNLMELIDKFNL